MRFRGFLGAALGASLFILGSSLISGVLATQPDGHKVTICHATNSDTNPYVVIDVDIASSGYLKAGHSNHTGPIWYAGAKDAHVKWGDIIPAYDYAPTTFHFAGLNWTDQGQAIWQDGCGVETETVAPSQSEVPSQSVVPSQSAAAETDVPSASSSPFQSVAAETDQPSEPNTATSTVGTSTPDGGVWVLGLALGAVLGSLLAVTPVRRRSDVNRSSSRSGGAA
jgi:hypothetical protein